MHTRRQAAGRTALADELHTRYGQALFGRRDFDSAMAHFGMCSAANPVLLLALFPSLAPRALLAPLLPSVAGAHARRARLTACQA